MLTLFRPATGKVRAEAMERATNVVLHSLAHQQLLRVLADLPPLPDAQTGQWGHRWSDLGFSEVEAREWPPV